MRVIAIPQALVARQSLELAFLISEALKDERVACQNGNGRKGVGQVAAGF